MATGFIHGIIALGLAAASGAAAAAEIALVGVIGDKAAIIAIDGGNPKAIKVGQTWKGIAVVSVEKDRATFEIDGKRRVIQRGMHYRSGEAETSKRQSATLSADERGHFFAEGTINGAHVRFMVDTGASAVVLPGSEAVRLGLDYRRGQRMRMQTASGPTEAYVATLDRIKVGNIELINVEAMVIEKGLNIALLGMTFLNRVEMKRDGQVMTLTRLF
jgi:aspartyl protease family protein